MAPVDSTHLFFTIWAATQTYADFDVQVRAVLGRDELTSRDHARATEHVVSLILRGWSAIMFAQGIRGLRARAPGHAAI